MSARAAFAAAVRPSRSASDSSRAFRGAPGAQSAAISGVSEGKSLPPAAPFRPPSVSPNRSTQCLRRLHKPRHFLLEVLGNDGLVYKDGRFTSHPPISMRIARLERQRLGMPPYFK